MNILHLQDKGFEASQPIIEALKSKGVSAIGAAGYCWGGECLSLVWFSYPPLCI